MGERLIRYYKHMADEMGLAARLVLARKTGIPSAKAALEPDSPENLKKFRDAIELITGKPAPKY
jgi:hypothetical protein